MLGLGRAAGARLAAILLLAVLALLPLDAIVHDLAFRHVVTHGVRLAANGFTELGTAWAGGGLLGALVVVGSRTRDAALTRAGLGGLIGIGVGSLAGQAVKQAVCRGRPGLLDGWGVDAPGTRGLDASRVAAARRFFHWPCLTDSRFHSFPSGHAITAFAAAAALTAVAPWGRWTWLGVAAGIGISRVLLNAHFVSDVLAGAAIGWWAGQVGVILSARLGAVRVRPLAWLGTGEARPRPGVSP
jgi:membrane-associated phospholipid phosphatase